jgi:hypothetical protein
MSTTSKAGWYFSVVSRIHSSTAARPRRIFPSSITAASAAKGASIASTSPSLTALKYASSGFGSFAFMALLLARTSAREALAASVRKMGIPSPDGKNARKVRYAPKGEREEMPAAIAADRVERALKFEYCLTDWGQALCPALDALLKWAAAA